MSRGQLPTFRRAQACTTNDTGPHNIYIYIYVLWKLGILLHTYTKTLFYILSPRSPCRRRGFGLGFCWPRQHLLVNSSRRQELVISLSCFVTLDQCLLVSMFGISVGAGKSVLASVTVDQ